MKKKIFFYFFLLISLYGYTQAIITGTVIDDKGMQLYNANIIAVPLIKTEKFAYTSTKEDGTFELNLVKNTPYKFTVSHIGYITIKKEIIVDETSKLIFTLKTDPNELEEVVITYKEPIVVKKDTTTYRVDAFTNGKERKLRQVLKKLPGVEVDRKGNVTVNGKKVTTVLVENKTFFTGDSKLAVNNIPADVINEIQVIEDYHDSPLLKGLETSDEVAMNISLKEDKKKFAFGDIEVGGGVKDRYLVHPKLFKYTEKVNYNFIGDFNNTNKKSFTLKDYINFDGGFDLSTFSNTFNSPIVKLLREEDFTDSEHLFGAFNVQWSSNEKNNWSTFVIGLKDNTNTRFEQNQEYLIDNIFEDRLTIGNQNQEMLLGKIQLKSKPNENVRIKFDTKVELSKANTVNNNKSNLSTGNLQFLNDKNARQFSLQSNFRVEKKFSRLHTSQVKTTFNATSANDNVLWNSEQNIFSSALPIINTSNYNISQNSTLKQYRFETYLKHFWIINPRNHLYLKATNTVEVNNYKNNANQLLPNNQFNNFQDFINNVKNNRIISSFDVEYKRLIGNAFATFKLQYQNYNRLNEQFNTKYTRAINLFLPEAIFDWELDRKRRLKFQYRLQSNFPDIEELSLNDRLRNFNSIYQGNINLQESYYHYLRLNFRKYQNYGWSFYPSISYRIRSKIIQNTLQPNDIYNTFSPVNAQTPAKEFASNFRVVYNYKYWKASLFTEYRNANYATFVNNQEVETTNNTLYARGGFRSVYINGPNVDISLGQSYNNNENNIFNNISDRTKFDFIIDYELENWQFKGEFFYNYFKNRVSKSTNSFNEINTSIFYQEEDSPWGFELEARNLSNNSNKLTSRLSNVLFNETKTFVFPRTILLKVIYKI